MNSIEQPAGEAWGSLSVMCSLHLRDWRAWGVMFDLAPIGIYVARIGPSRVCVTRQYSLAPLIDPRPVSNAAGSAGRGQLTGR